MPPPSTQWVLSCPPHASPHASPRPLRPLRPLHTSCITCQTLAKCAEASDEVELKRALQVLLALVQDRAAVRSSESRTKIVFMAKAKQRGSSSVWTRDVAKLYGRVLREMSMLRSMLRVVSEQTQFVFGTGSGRGDFMGVPVQELQERDIEEGSDNSE